MPTVIDQLIVELKLDPKGFTEGQKKATESLRGFEKEHERHTKKVTKDTDGLTQAFKNLQGQLLAVAGLFTGGMGIAAFTDHISRLTAHTGYLATSLGKSAAELGKWQALGSSVGASAEEMAQGFAAVQRGFQDLHLGNPSGMMSFSYLTQSKGSKGPPVYMQKNGKDVSPTEWLMDVSRWLAAQPDKGLANRAIQQHLGYGQGMINALNLGPDELAKRLKEYEKYGPTEEQVRRMQELQKAFGEATVSAEKLGREILSRLEPGLVKVFQTISNWLNSIDQKSKEGPVSNYLDSAAPALEGAYKWYSNPWQGMKGLWNKGKSWLSGSSEGTQPTPPGAVGGGTSGGTRGDRNMNPGNIKYGDYAKSMGATGQDEKGFAIFPTLDQGKKAADGLLQDKYGGLTLKQIQEKWVGNSDAGYLGGLRAATGLGDNDVPDLQNPEMRAKILQGISRGEGTSLTGELKGGGGARANFMGGPIPGSSEMTKITTNGGHTVTVNKASAPYFLGFLNDMEAAGAPIKSIGGHNIRRIAGSGRFSQHAYGNAIDVNQRGRNIVSPEFQAWSDANRAKIGQISSKWGMINGGNWRNPDFGHWEWGGGTSGMAIGSKGAFMGGGSNTTNNNQRSTSTTIENMHVQVPPGSDPVGYGSGIRQELQRYDSVGNSNQGLL